MSIDPVGLSQLYSTQQTQALSAVSADVPMDPPSGDSTPPADGSNALTGTATSNLDSQTLQALLDLTQQDSGDTPQTNKTGQPSQTGQVQHRHHHHGGGMRASSQTPPNDSSQASTAADGGSPATASETESDAAEASLTSALLNA